MVWEKGSRDRLTFTQGTRFSCFSLTARLIRYDLIRKRIVIDNIGLAPPPPQKKNYDICTNVYHSFGHINCTLVFLGHYCCHGDSVCGEQTTKKNRDKRGQH